MKIRRGVKALALAAAGAAFLTLGPTIGTASAVDQGSVFGFGTGQCLYGDASSQYVRVTTCTSNTPNQIWGFVPNIQSGYLGLKNFGLQKCMAVDNNLNRASILLVPCDYGSTAQGWQRLKSSDVPNDPFDEIAELRSGFGGNKCLDRPTEFHYDGEYMQLWDCANPTPSIFETTHYEQRMEISSGS